MATALEPLFRKFSFFAEPMVGIHATDGTIETVNHTTLRILDVRPSAIIGANWRDFVIENDHAGEEAALKQVISSGRPYYTKVRGRLHSHDATLTAVQKISIVCNHNSNLSFMKEAFLLEDGVAKDYDLADDKNPMAFIASQAKFLRGIALQNDEELLSYLLGAAALQAYRRGGGTDLT